MLSLPTIEIVLPGKTKPTSSSLASPPNTSVYRTCAKTGAKICSKTGKILRTGGFVWPIKLALGILDLLAAPFGRMTGRDINFPILYKVGGAFIVLGVFLHHILNTSVANILKEAGMQPTLAGHLAQVVIWGFPGFLALMGTCMFVGGIRLWQGKSFHDKYAKQLEPLPAFESGIIFKIGDVKLSLRDTHTGIGAFGGIGSGKTVSLMVPMMRQFFQQLRDSDENSEFARCGALILDEKGDFIDSTITEMILAHRSLQDLVIIDPDLDLYRYNPLDPNQTADENAAKLAKVQKILGTSSGGDNAYWDQTSQSTIKFFLQLLEVYKPKHKIGLDDVARFMRDDDMATVLCDRVEEIIEEKKRNNEISEEAYGAYTDAVSNTRNAWIQLNPNTKSTLKTTITNMLGPIASNPRLQKVFCRDTNFSFRDLPNRGKVVLFRGSGIDKSTARLICVCLKIDFQTWQKRRNGSAATAFGLNTTRTVVFICDEYQEFVTCGGEGDETFYGVSRSTRTAPIVATQSYNSLETAIKNKEQTKTLRQNIATWVFFRSTDQDTCELGKFLAGQSKKEDFSTSQDTTGFMETASNLSGSGSGKGSSINISKKLEENFRADDFSRLVTMTMEKSKSGPWYSEAIVYHYHDIDDSAESRCYKTRLSHLYYPEKLRKQAALNVKHLDHILYDRNWQRKALQRGLLLIQNSLEHASAEKQRSQLKQEGLHALKTAEENEKNDPRAKNRAEQIQKLREETKTRTERITQNPKIKTQGAIAEESHNLTELLQQKAALEKEKEETLEESEKENLTIQISDTTQRISVLRLESAREVTEGKEILRADDNLLEEEFHLHTDPLLNKPYTPPNEDQPPSEDTPTSETLREDDLWGHTLEDSNDPLDSPLSAIEEAIPTDIFLRKRETQPPEEETQKDEQHHMIPPPQKTLGNDIKPAPNNYDDNDADSNENHNESTTDGGDTDTTEDTTETLLGDETNEDGWLHPWENPNKTT
jgi:hypothetical protein